MSEDAFGSFLERIHDPLTAWCSAVTEGTGVDEGDLRGSAVLRLHQLRSKISGDDETDRPFAFKVAKHVFLELRRARARDLREMGPRSPETSRAAPLVQLPASWTSASRDARRREGVERFLAGFRELAKDDRDVLRRHFLEGETIAAVARDLGLDAAHLRVRLARIRLDLRHRIGEAALAAIISDH